MFNRFPHISAIKLAIATGALALSALSLNAQAANAVTSYIVNDVNLVGFTINSGTKYAYSYTTTQDANLFGTMKASAGDKDNNGVNDLVEAILAVSPTVTDAYGTANLKSYDLGNNSGKLTYFGSLAFMNYLNSISYAGSNQWYLSDTPTTYAFLFDYGYGASGSLINIQDGFYRNSNGYIDMDSGVPEPVVYLIGVGSYEDYTDNSSVDYRNYSSQHYAIFVTKGLIADVSAVPEPENAAMLMVGLGLMGAVVRRRKQQA